MSSSGKVCKSKNKGEKKCLNITGAFQISPQDNWAQFQRAAKHANLLSMKLLPEINRITNRIIQLLFDYPENHMEI